MEHCAEVFGLVAREDDSSVRGSNGATEHRRSYLGFECMLLGMKDAVGDTEGEGALLLRVFAR